ncbi:MAG: hypothetical protein A2138_28035 [Deltaproteobacteria bacterium RBG_16_71_12]|nr:MAG: hypothetical protein A2138_28035 [Deltaproteobacteria bacterium RBG_16_71_12]
MARACGRLLHPLISTHSLAVAVALGSGCPAVTVLDAGVTDDAGASDAGASDGGDADGGGDDAGPVDAGSVDAGSGDAGSGDAGSVDAGISDAGCGTDGPDVPCAECSAALGTVVDLGGFQSTSAPEAPLVRTDAERMLLFSDSPEAPSTSGLLFRADVPAGPARVVLYHVNGYGGGDKKVSVVVENQGSSAVTAHLERFAVPPPSTSYVEQGQAAVRAFLGADNPADKTVPADGAALLLLDNLDAIAVAPGELIHAIVDVTFDGPVGVRVVMLDAGSDTLASYQSLAALPRDVHDRGTFAGADRRLELVGCAWPSGAQRVRVGADTALLPDPRGVDELTGADAVLRGHYGTLVSIVLPAGASERAVLLVPRAGSYAGAARVTVGAGAPVVVDAPASGAVTNNTTAALLGIFPPGSAGLVELVPAGGSSLPVDLVVLPLP